MNDQQKESGTRESGLPGGGSGRKDEVGGSGIYPASGPYPPGNAEIRAQASWGQSERGAAGYADHGTSGLSYAGEQLLGGYSPENRGRQTLNVQIPADEVILEGDLNVPGDLRGIVLFAHGSGSSRHSPRNQYVAHVLQEGGIATLLFDLLTGEEESLDRETGHLRFNIDLLAKRLLHATRWIVKLPQIEEMKLGYFGASTGAAAALIAALAAVNDVGAVVSRGGRPDLAGPALSKVQAPTLLIVGGKDETVLELNREALSQLPGEKRLEIVPGATHLFEETGALEEVARLAREWFERHLGRREHKSQAA
jgi:putative phosphoribosyl transferase